VQLEKLATVTFKGKKCDVVLSANQWAEIRFDGQKFVANKKLQNNFNLLVKKYEEYCSNELKGIIRRGIAKLRSKKIETQIEYTDGQKNFLKKVKLSVNDYIKMLGFSGNLDFKIGNYERERGINEVNPKSKKFTLFFNASLIKYNHGPHIEYVVAHELTHVFHRDHGPLFQKALGNLFPQKNSSEEFFNRGISSIFTAPGKTSSLVFYAIMAFAVLALVYWMSGFLSSFLPSFFDSAPTKPVF